MLSEREKYWQAQLITLTRGLNSPNEWYVQNKRGYRKEKKIFCRRIHSRLEFISCRNQLAFSLYLIYGGFLYDINSCCGNSKQTIVTSLFDLYTELTM